ncbi:hypothetical protein Tco_0724096 [Tanacetum coccineum]
MVKREFEIEIVGGVCDEIDRLAELIGKHEADQHWPLESVTTYSLKPCYSSQGLKANSGPFSSETKNLLHVVDSSYKFHYAFP